MTSKFKLRLFGQFCLKTANGEDVTPRSAKMQAILAMLAVAPEKERARTWLRNRLWSDRGHSQAAASLRQDISEFRKFIDPSSALIEVERNSLRLLPDAVQIEKDQNDGQIFLEGIRVRDPAFRAWLLEQRERVERPDGNVHALSSAPISGTPKVIVRAPMQDAAERFLATSILDTVADTLAERTSLEIVFENASTELGDYALTAEGFTLGDKGGIRVRLDDLVKTRSIWASGGDFEVRDGIESKKTLLADETLSQLVNEASERLLHECMERWRRGNFALDATVACTTGIRKLFTFDLDEQIEADRLFELAFSKDPRGLYLAWRVMLRVIRFIELPNSDIAVTREEISDLSARALDLEPGNSMVLSAAANAALLVQEDMLAARELASRALKVNPTNPFAWDCNSIWHLMASDFEKAHMMQLRARTISSDPRCKHWWDMGCALTATVTGRLEEARYYAECASALVPQFRPPLRYLTALYANENRIEEAEASSRKLKLIEPEFSLDRMVSDPKYPSAALKRSSLANRELVRRLSWAE